MLIFGPQSLSFDAQTFRELGQALKQSNSHKWILKAFTDSLAHWQTLVSKLPQLEQIDTAKWVNCLSKWLADGSIEGDIASWPNAILTPLVVTGHLVQYQNYLNATATVHASKRSDVLGFCVGLLSVSAITASHNSEKLLHNARNAITIGMMIGSLVDAYDGTQSQGPSQSLAVAWTKSEDELIAEQILQQIPNVCYPTSLIIFLSTDRKNPQGLCFCSIRLESSHNHTSTIKDFRSAEPLRC